MKNLSFIVALLGFLPIFLFGQWVSNPMENTLIGTGPGDQAIPKVGTCESGSTYIAWFSNEGANYNVRLQKLDVYGNKLWAEEGLLVSDHTSMSWLTDWDMTVDQEDCAILTLQDIRNVDNDAFAYRISPDGEFLWGEDGIEMSTGPAFDAAPKVTVTNAGNAVFAWQAETVIIMQKISPEGNKLWGDNGITLSGANTYSWPQLMPVGDDDVIMKYFEDSGPSWAPTRHVFAQRYDADGIEVWTEPAIISDAGGISAWTQIFPLLNDGNDGFFIAWHDDRDNNMLASVWVQHIDADGNVLLSDNGVEASTMTGRNHFYPYLSLPTGSEDIYVFWNEMDGDQNNRGIYGQKISSTSERLWTDNGKTFIEISSTNVYPFAAGNTNEDAIVFYEHYFDGINASIKAMRIDADGNFVWPGEMVDLCTVNSQKIHTYVGNFNNGQWIASWEDTRSGNADIYGQNIQVDGTLGPVTIPSNLTVTPDTVICDEVGPHYVYIENNTPNAIMINEIYFDQWSYVDFETPPTLPYSLGSNETLEIGLYVMVITYNFNPNGYVYDLMVIESEVDTNDVVIAINEDLLAKINTNSIDQVRINVYPNPSAESVTFEFSGMESPSELDIYNSTGKLIRSFNVNGLDAITWDGNNINNQKVEYGTYFYKAFYKETAVRGKIIIMQQ
ncbi:MAG: T9SS type A sorting domain-containing protein [Bacteroidales bacterium]|nr:T9SS type A sorting domain-containing protein [Bacteroidales bacterium]